MVVGLVLLGAFAVATACAVARADAGAASAARLTLDGATFTPELASTTSARGKGLMNRSTAPKDGMLFVFPRPTSERVLDEEHPGPARDHVLRRRREAREQAPDEAVPP